MLFVMRGVYTPKNSQLKFLPSLSFMNSKNNVVKGQGDEDVESASSKLIQVLTSIVKIVESPFREGTDLTPGSVFAIGFA